MPLGDLLNICRTEQLSLFEKLILIEQAASGMCCLSDERIVHCDLSLRNILVMPGKNSKYHIKIADFGLAHHLVDKDYYQKLDISLPVRWSAPEALKQGKFSTVRW